VLGTLVEQPLWQRQCSGHGGDMLWGVDPVAGASLAVWLVTHHGCGGSVLWCGARPYVSRGQLLAWFTF
jgi:hypothetical protein